MEPERDPELGRRLTRDEHVAALRMAEETGLRPVDVRDPHPKLRRRLAVL